MHGLSTRGLISAELRQTTWPGGAIKGEVGWKSFSCIFDQRVFDKRFELHPGQLERRALRHNWCGWEYNAEEALDVFQA